MTEGYLFCYIRSVGELMTRRNFLKNLFGAAAIVAMDKGGASDLRIPGFRVYSKEQLEQLGKGPFNEYFDVGSLDFDPIFNFSQLENSQRSSGNEMNAAYRQIGVLSGDKPSSNMYKAAQTIRRLVPDADNFHFFFRWTNTKPVLISDAKFGTVWYWDSSRNEPHQIATQEKGNNRSVIYTNNGVMLSPNSIEARWRFVTSSGVTVETDFEQFAYPISLPQSVDGVRRTVISNTIAMNTGETKSHNYSRLWYGNEGLLKVIKDPGGSEVVMGEMISNDKTYMLAHMGGDWFVRLTNVGKKIYADRYDADGNRYVDWGNDVFKMKFDRLLGRMFGSSNYFIVRRNDDLLGRELYIVGKAPDGKLDIGVLQNKELDGKLDFYSHSLNGGVDMGPDESPSVVENDGERLLIIYDKNLKKSYLVARFTNAGAQLVSPAVEFDPNDLNMKREVKF